MTPVTYFRYLLLAATLYSPGLFGQSTDKNFVLARTYKAARTTVSGNVKDATQEVAYLDGLGRPLQSISAQASPLLTGSRSADLVSHTEYDASGRPFMQYAPYPVQGNGAFRSNAAAAAVDYYNSSNFCQNNNRGYTLLEYEAVPDEKVKKQYVAGSERAIEYTYRGNASGEVKRYVVSGTSVQYPGDYGAGQLSCVQTKDENGNRTREYRDKTGSVVLRRVYLSDNDSEKLDTYYVYDDYDQLRFVLQPQFQDNANIDLYAFKYTYNSKGLVSSKYVPGGGTTNMVYDERDRLKESTDGRGKITYYKYDELNRVTETGEKSGSTETPLSRVHYDTYSPSFGGSEAFVGAGGDYPGSYRTAVKGKQTVSANRVLNADGTYGSWLYATIYYDDRYNPIQTVRSLFDIGGTARERNSNVRRFDGRIEKELTLQQTGSGDYSVEKLYSYDHSDRQLSSRYIVKKGGDVKKDIYLSASRYNGIGQLKNKFLHSVDAAATFREKLDYCYTPRNFLSKITGSVSSGENYGVELRYTNPAEATAQYNGNIAEMLWKRGTSWVGYKFSYDRANRLTNGDGLNNNYRETVTGYDRNGNITGLQRVSNGSNIDNLTYDYSANGNRLKKVTDAENNANGFNNGSSGSSDDYAYDGNGNLTQDLNRGIAAGGLRYNFNDLVREAVVGGYTVQYHFDASGTKLRMSNSNGAVNTKYAGAFEYNQGNYLTRIGTGEGQVRVTNNGNDFALEYYLTDHLGNVRQVISEAGAVVQETEYFPFGLEIASDNPAQSQAQRNGINKYTFLNREKQPETGYMDLLRRFYDPTISRFIQVDPVTETQEHLSVFQYGWNNPILRSDPNGDCPNCLTAAAGALLKGGAELGGQLLAGKSLREVDWADVGIEATKGLILGSGVGAVGAGLMEAGGLIAKASMDYFRADGLKTVANGRKSVNEAAFDGAADFVGGKVSGKIMSGLTGSLESTAKRLAKESDTANRAASIAKSYANETQKHSAKNYSGKLAADAAKAEAKKVVVSSAATLLRSPVAETVKNGYQNRTSDAVKAIAKYELNKDKNK